MVPRTTRKKIHLQLSHGIIKAADYILYVCAYGRAGHVFTCIHNTYVL